MQEWISHMSNAIEQSFIIDDRWVLYLKGLTVTLRVALLALVLGIAIGVIIAVIRTAHDSQSRNAHGMGHVLLNIGDKICRI